MRTDVRMTIQDYFKRTGIRTHFNRDAQNVRRPEEKEASAITGASSFLKALDTAQSSAGAKLEHQGMRIQDYVARPVQVIRPNRASAPAPKHERLIPQETARPPQIDTRPKKTEPPALNGEANPEAVAVSDSDKILKSIDEAAKKYNLSPSLIRAVVQAESDYQVRAVSPAGAQGLMQLMPATARELGVQNPFDIDQNVDGGAKYLRKMLDQFDGDLKTALSAYNAGPGTVARFHGNVPYRETRNYVERVLRFSRQFS